MKLGLHLLARISLAALALLVLPATIATAANVSATGSISRDPNLAYFNIDIVVTDAKTNALTGTETDLFKNRIRVWVPASSTLTDYIPFGGTAQLPNVPFTIRESGPMSSVLNGHSLYDLTFHAQITQTTATAIKDLGTSVNLTVRYYENGNATPVAEQLTNLISKSSAIVSDAPTGIAATGTHNSLIITWTAPLTVAWTAEAPRAPSQITVLAIDKTTLDTDLPAYIYVATAATDTAAEGGTCTFNANFTDGDQCITCTNENAYLDPSKLELLTAGGIFKQSTSKVTDGKFSIPGLENGKPYAVVSFYEPGGLKRSSCVTGTPEPNTTLAELNGENPATLMDPKCFIATAAYGSPLHKNLKPLRWFRDRVLLKTTAGKVFVSWYYEHGPRGARFINEYPALKPVVQGVLWVPVMLLSAWMAVAGNDPQLIVIVFMAFLAAMITATFVARKTREEA